MEQSLLRTHLSGGGGGSGLLYISIAYYMQKGGKGVKIACKIVYILNGRLFFTLLPYYHWILNRDSVSNDNMVLR